MVLFNLSEYLFCIKTKQKISADSGLSSYPWRRKYPQEVGFFLRLLLVGTFLMPFLSYLFKHVMWKVWEGDNLGKFADLQDHNGGNYLSQTQD